MARECDLTSGRVPAVSVWTVASETLPGANRKWDVGVGVDVGDYLYLGCHSFARLTFSYGRGLEVIPHSLAGVKPWQSWPTVFQANIL
ncbi:hypothetical protein HYFRA_00013429 [Hymenoscyphus fraxineus]|uniref:Uncharacterized protein n=1 Tax=Hymenoscyphus fraxineus TaxID=746836 RepID=A0A9N9PYQ7_9HELO|nr:hypothetical protein HYFRA_00013429 [Hymenoscyphus fraxineus]